MMARAVPEWIGATPDTPIPDRVKLRVFLRFDGACPKCTRKLMPGQWDADHVIAIINGGENRESNLQPLCDTPCHSRKTKADVAAKSRTYKARKRNAGMRKPRTIRAWRRFDGTPVYAERER